MKNQNDKYAELDKQISKEVKDEMRGIVYPAICYDCKGTGIHIGTKDHCTNCNGVGSYDLLID